MKIKKAIHFFLVPLLYQPNFIHAAADLDAAMKNPRNWAHPRGQYNNQGYSKLDQINLSNVKKLQLAWTFSTGVNRGHEGAPLVVDGVMFVHTAFPNNVYALDLNNDRKILWSYFPKQDPRTQAIFCCGNVNRGLGFGDGKIYLQQNDGILVALNAKTGKVEWKVRVNDSRTGASNSNAPQVIKDKVLTGCAGGEFGVRCFIAAYYLKDGSLAWKAYSTGSDEDALIGDDFNKSNPQYSALSVYEDINGGNKQGGSFQPIPSDDLKVGEKNLGVRTWLIPQQEKDGWQQGGGAVTGYIGFDTKTNLVYYGTGNPGVWNPDARPGDNKWTNSVFARDIDTGYARWAMQMTPHDEWDYDATNEVILFEQGKSTYAAQVNKNGFIYTWLASNGNLISAEKVHGLINWAGGVNLKTGVPEKDPKFSTHRDYNSKGICPSTLGVKGVANPAAYSPQSKLLYIPLYRTCMTYEPIESIYAAGQPWVGATTTRYSDSGSYGGIAAFDIITNKLKWYNKEQHLATSGVLATAGNLVFYSAGNRWFKAADAGTGNVMWQFQVGSPVVGNPFAYSHKGKQFVGVMAGLGGGVATSFWGEPTHVACTPGRADSSLEKGYAKELWVGAIDCGYSPTVLGLGAGMLHIFSL